jgi:hypothetical protein
MTNGISRIVFTAIAFAFLSIAAHAATQRYSAQLTAAAQVPPDTSVGTGTFTATLNSETRTFSYTLRFEGLTGPATAAYVHGPAARGVNAGVVIPLGINPVSAVYGSETLTDDQMKQLEAGLWYVAVHTSAHPGGEIRGQIVKRLNAVKKAGGGQKN